jgi:hypothetical protein
LDFVKHIPGVLNTVGGALVFIVLVFIVLFSLFIEDLENLLQRNIHDGIEIDQITLFLLLFADDVVLFAETPDGLQRSLDAVYDYCSRWRLKVNCDKAKIMVLKKGKQPQGLVFT